MPPTDVDRVKTILAEAIEKVGPDRRAFLDQACGSDAILRAEVESLLASAEEAGEFLQSPTAGAPAASEDPLREGPGSIIGPYKLLELIGEGGFGSVFMAEQQFPIRRKVALKIIKLGMDTRQVIARFEAERQALAMMDHPNIAKVFDAGATESGRPYFVMELVKGEPITEYADQNQLTIRERLELFSQVCNAIQHAHQKGVIHRDIKPRNVLVSTQDGHPLAKVIDFGIAKAMSAQLTDKTLFTEFKQLIGTPQYMSPEQAAGSLDIDTRTDIYSLGVLLYELLTGTTPFSAEELRSAAYDEMRRIIREEEPPRPSTRLSQSTATLPSVAALRGSEPKKLDSMVRGDLDWVVMKTLEKDRGRRYETANALTQDIQRHLNNESILARPSSATYRFWKMVRRNKLAFAATSAVVAALIIGLGVSTWEFGKERAARQRAVAAEQVEARLRQQAESETAKAKAVTRFLEQALSTVSPYGGGNKGVLVRDLLDDTARKLDDGAFRDEPDVEASLRQTVGETYVDLGSLDAARPHLERALELRRELYGDQDVRVADSLCDLASLSGPTAVPSLEKAMAIQQAVFGPNAPQVAGTLEQLAYEDIDHAERSVTVARYRRALEIYSKAGLENTPQGIHALHYLGLSIGRAGDLAGAIRLEREAVEKSRRFIRDKSEIADGLVDLAAALKVAGQPADIEALYREALADLRDSVDFSHTDMNQAVEGLTEFLKSRGKPEKAEAVLLEQCALLNADPRCTPQEEQWLLQRIVSLYQGWHPEKLAKWQSKFETVTDEVILRDPTSAADALEVCARSCAQHGRVAEAIAAAAKAIELKPANPSLYHGLAALLVAANDVDGYRRAMPADSHTIRPNQGCGHCRPDGQGLLDPSQLRSGPGRGQSMGRNDGDEWQDR
jgi:eukaryotic-like serine/threonine-protein kinase